MASDTTSVRRPTLGHQHSDFLIGMKCDLIFGMGENQTHPDISDFSSRKNQAHPDISDLCRAQHPDLRMHPDEAPSEHPC